MGIVDHWSYSAINTYEKCPWAWYQSYVLRVKQAENDNFKIGKAFHYMLEMNAKRWLTDGSHYPLEESVKIFKSMWYKSHELLVHSYYRKNDWLVPLGAEFIEWPFLIDCYGVKLKGVVDIVTADHDVMDYKTSTKPYATSDVQDSLQLDLYAGVYHERFKVLPRRVGYQVAMKDFSGVQKLTDTRSLAQVDKAFKLVKQYDDEVNDTKVFEKKRGRNCHWCDYRDVCL